MSKGQHPLARGYYEFDEDELIAVRGMPHSGDFCDAAERFDQAAEEAADAGEILWYVRFKQEAKEKHQLMREAMAFEKRWAFWPYECPPYSYRPPCSPKDWRAR